MLFISCHCHLSGEKHFCPPSQTFVLRGVTIRNALEMLFSKKVDEKHFVLFASTLTPSIVHDEHGSRKLSCCWLSRRIDRNARFEYLGRLANLAVRRDDGCRVG